MVKRKSEMEKKQDQIQKRRERVKLMYIEGMKISEIAKLEDVTTYTIESDLHYLQKQGGIIRNRTVTKIKNTDKNTNRTNRILDIEGMDKEYILQKNREKLKVEFERKTIWSVLRAKVESGNKVTIENYIDKILEARPKSFSKEDFKLILRYKNMISIAKSGLTLSDKEILLKEKEKLCDKEEER